MQTIPNYFQRGLRFTEPFFRAGGGAAVHGLMESSGEHADGVIDLAKIDASTGKLVKELWTILGQRTGWAAGLLNRMQNLAGTKHLNALVLTDCSRSEDRKLDKPDAAFKPKQGGEEDNAPVGVGVIPSVV
uniref:Uncharacterized protein n=1 Tax=Melanopsichium pennsylvanicum 4 TaxID=1398559 RepID=A0A077QWR0_9BASI|nr:uncharacterized protein BN887_06004 [Melanopsichium pennsylvanicum 4]